MMLFDIDKPTNPGHLIFGKYSKTSEILRSDIISYKYKITQDGECKLFLVKWGNNNEIINMSDPTKNKKFKFMVDPNQVIS